MGGRATGAVPNDSTRPAPQGGPKHGDTLFSFEGYNLRDLRDIDDYTKLENIQVLTPKRCHLHANAQNSSPGGPRSGSKPRRGGGIGGERDVRERCVRWRRIGIGAMGGSGGHPARNLRRMHAAGPELHHEREFEGGVSHVNAAASLVAADRHAKAAATWQSRHRHSVSSNLDSVTPQLTCANSARRPSPARSHSTAALPLLDDVEKPDEAELSCDEARAEMQSQEDLEGGECEEDESRRATSTSKG
uniref:Uncharacterized protein n=1 Tax=Mycena chlorophos TaxID=658473 RepID=A0ABQ0L7T0_MYCCL|nr:predicted protein [Mycena chlorophos]